jgi:hypothetical protein
MRLSFVALALAGALSACGPLPPPPDTAQLPPGVFSPLDQDVPATQYAQYAFADPSRTYGNPVAGAQAVLAMDYIAGELNTSPRWANINASTQQQLLQGRIQTRQAVGIAPGAPSQLVVNSLVAARNDLASGNQAAAAAALSNPAFTKGGNETVQALANLPYIQMANVATTHASEELFGPGNSESDRPD